jgi:predicted RNA-binding Zn ribbon-like protein
VQSRFEFTGGNVALDFANTVNSRPTDCPEELLVDYAAFASWAREAGVLTPIAYERLYVQGVKAPERATQALDDARKLRDATFAVFSAVAGQRTVPGTALALVSLRAQDAGAHRRLAHTARGFEWEWLQMDTYLSAPLWPVAHAAANLLVSDQVTRVRMCASDSCDWLFLDISRNQMRRWCDMKTCGNRDKARRHYERTKS